MKIKNNIAPEFYEPSFYNDLSLKIIDVLRISFKKCNKFLINEGYNSYDNLIGIFFHHLTKLLTSYIFCKTEIMLSKSEFDNIPDNISFDSKKRMVWPINYINVLNRNYVPIGYENLNFIPESLSRKTKYLIKSSIESIRSLNIYFSNKLKTRPHILLSSNSGFRIEDLKGELNCDVIELNIIKSYIPAFRKQMNILYNEINVIDIELASIFSCKTFFDDNFLIFLEKELLSYLNIKEENNFSASLLVVGSLADLKTRISCAVAKKNNVPVISIWHGDTIGDKNEPVFGPVEQSFSDIILGYGDYGCKDLQKGIYNNSLYNSKPKVVPTTSSKINNIYKGGKISIIKDFSSESIMYVPTSFSGTNRYGPFRDIHDFAYYNWQKDLLQNVDTIMNPSKLIRKGHRKDIMKINMNLPFVDKIDNVEFSELLELSSIFIFDYVTTAFAIAAATNKPIIYFDIGLRNLMPDALKSIKDRCIYIKGDARTAKKMVVEAFDMRKELCKNTFTKRYSISEDKKTQKQILLEQIKLVMGIS